MTPMIKPLVLIILFVLTGCSTPQVTGYTDSNIALLQGFNPAHSGKTLTGKYAIFIQSGTWKTKALSNPICTAHDVDANATFGLAITRVILGIVEEGEVLESVISQDKLAERGDVAEYIFRTQDFGAFTTGDREGWNGIAAAAHIVAELQIDILTTEGPPSRARITTTKIRRVSAKDSGVCRVRAAALSKAVSAMLEDIIKLSVERIFDMPALQPFLTSGRGENKIRDKLTTRRSP